MSTRLNPRLAKRERLAVSSAVVSFAESNYTHTPVAGSNETGQPVTTKASGALLQVTGSDSIYWTVDGSTPSAAVGFLATAGDFITLDSLQKVKNFKAIRVTTDTSIEAQFLFGA
jgi:hypothetical protein